MPKEKLSVVVLCYKAGELVPVFVSKIKELLKKNNISNEIVLVCNYNPGEFDTDRTHHIAKENFGNDSEVLIIAKEKEGMMGWDMASGLSSATGDRVLIIDGDGQMPLEDITKVYKLSVEGDYDFVKTYRTERFDGLYRKTISRVYNLILKILFPKVKVRDANSKPKIFKRKALDKLKLRSTGWFIDAEIVIQASHLDFSIAEVETFFKKNEHRASFVKPTAILEFIRNLIEYRLFHVGKIKK